MMNKSRVQLSWIAYKTLVRKEVTRFFRIWTQALVPPIITQSLYFVIFGAFIGSQVRAINGVSYMGFIVPGLVMMSVINNSYSNVAGSFFSSKFQRSIEELLVSPASKWVIMLGYATGGALRGIICGTLVFIVSLLFTRPEIHHVGFILLFAVICSFLFSLAGLYNGIVAKKFDDISIMPTFVLTPLIYLGGVFYSIDSLPGFWQKVSLANPILYMVNGFRFGFHGFSDVNIWLSLLILIGFTIALLILNIWTLKSGKGLKS